MGVDGRHETEAFQKQIESDAGRSRWPENACPVMLPNSLDISLDKECATMSEPRRELVRSTLGVLVIGALIVASFWVMRPFIAATIWATMIVVSTWPVLKWLEARLWRRRSLAVLVMTLLLLLLLVVPLTLAVATIVGHAGEVAARASALANYQVSPPPAWLKGLPFIGANAAQSL
jgi:predicted PurR-regulated permease PerM